MLDKYMKLFNPPGLTTVTLSLNHEQVPLTSADQPGPERTYLERWKESLNETPFLMDVCLVGGDPFRSPWLSEVVAVCQEHDLTLSVDTTANFAFSELNPEFLKGISQIRVWLYSLHASVHDAATTCGQYRKAIEFIDWLRHHFRGAKVLVFPLREDNKTEIEAMAAFAQHKGFRSNFIPCPLSSGHPNLLTRESFWEAAGRVAKLKNVSPKDVYASIPLGGVLYDNLGYFCPAMLGLQLHLDLTTGHVAGCYWDHGILGSLKNLSLSQIYKEFRRRVDTEKTLQCIGCHHWQKCFGGCLGNKKSLAHVDRYCFFVEAPLQGDS